jgi:GntR family transcriptional regulator
MLFRTLLARQGAILYEHLHLESRGRWAAVRKTKPKHRQIAEQLRKRIAEDHYGSTELPRELSLMDEFRVSRHTIRSALQHLVNEGLIERRAGSGTKVTDRARGGIWAIGSLGELIGEFTPDQYLTISAREEPSAPYPSIAELFGLSRNAPLFHILRLLMISSQPYAVANVFTLAEYGRVLPEGEIGRKPLIDLVEKYARARPTRARQAASARSADREVARQLGIDEGAAVLLLQRTYFDADGVPFLHADVLCRPDRYQQVMDFVHEPAPGDGTARKSH